MSAEKFNINNFDLVRLLAALQVALHHSLRFMEVEHVDWILTDISRLFPGVPIFFFVSGFLISRSYENNPSLSEYARNRVLRIYPALFVCTLLAVLSVYLTGYLSTINASMGEILLWCSGQVSFVQFYNPEFMRGFGTGVLNGSLWTIFVELQFYVIIPIFYVYFFRKWSNIALIALIVFLIVLNFIHIPFQSRYSETIFYKLWRISFFPWIYMFLVGVLYQRNFDLVYRLLKNKLWLLLFVYVSIAYSSATYLGWQLGNGINPILFFILVSLVFSFSYSSPTLSNKFLRNNDISYGVYIYHIPVINLFIYYGCLGSSYFIWLVLLIVAILSIMSWVFIEKPCLALKRYRSH